MSGSAFKPRIAANATQSLIAWEEENDIPGNTFGGTKIRAARIAHDGTVLDSVALVPDSNTDSEDHAGVASDGQNFLLTWHRSSSIEAPSTIEGAVVGADGTFVAPELSISRSSGETELPSVAFDGTRYLVAWQDQRDDVPAAFGTAVSTTGTVLGDADTRLSSLPIQPTFDRTALAWNGADFLLAYLGTRDVPNGPFISGMSGSLIAPDLSIAADSLSFASLPNSQVPSAAVWNGQRYLVTWIDDRNLAFDQDTVRGVLIEQWRPGPGSRGHRGVRNLQRLQPERGVGRLRERRTLAGHLDHANRSGLGTRRRRQRRARAGPLARARRLQRGVSDRQQRRRLLRAAGARERRRPARGSDSARASV